MIQREEIHQELLHTSQGTEVRAPAHVQTVSATETRVMQKLTRVTPVTRPVDSTSKFPTKQGIETW